MKSWYQSKTMWAAIAIFAVGVLDLLTGLLTELDLQEGWVLVAIGALKAALRSVTDEPVTIRKEKP